MKALKFCFVFVLALTLASCDKDKEWSEEEFSCMEMEVEEKCWEEMEEDCDCKCGDKKGKGKKGKGKKGKGKKKDMLKKIESMTECTDNTFIDLANLPANVKQYDLKPLAYDSTGTCPIKGFVKFVDTVQNQTLAMVNFFPVGKTGYAVKINCVNGDCKHDAATICKVKSACAPQPVSSNK